MATRITLFRRSLLRPLLSQTRHLSKTPLPLQNPNSLSQLAASSPPKVSPFSPSPLPPFFFLPSRTISSSSSPSNIVLIGSKDGFDTALNKVRTCRRSSTLRQFGVGLGLADSRRKNASNYYQQFFEGRFISPVIEEMSKKFPHVTTYKIDIDQDGLGSTLSELNIYSVPTLHFFKDGGKVTEVVGADVARLKDAMEDLYKLPCWWEHLSSNLLKEAYGRLINYPKEQTKWGNLIL